VNEQTVKRFAVLAAAAGLSTWAIDMAATQVGLVSQQAALGISVTASQWILNLTLMIVAGLVTVGGALGDRVGRLRIFRLGIILIALGALVTFGAGLVKLFPAVLLGRGVEGLGAALFLPAATALLLDVYPRAERGGAQGRMMMLSMTVTAFAPTVIGLVIQAVAWPFAYLLTIAAAVVTFFLLRKVSYEQKKAAATPFDYTGSVLVFLAVALLITGIMQGGTAGLTSPTVLIMVGAGLLVGLALVVLSLRKEHPLIQFRVLKIRSVAIAVFVSLMRFLPSVLMGAFVARYVQQVLGLSPTVAGLLMILPVLAQVVAAPVAGRMLDKDGPRTPVSLGALLLVAGLLFLAFGFPRDSLWLILIGTILGGAGFSFMNPVQMAALSETPLVQRGMLAGIFPLAGNFGTALFVALLTAGLSMLMNNYMASNLGATDAAAQSAALGTLAWISVAVTLVTLIVSLMLRKPAASAPAAASQPQPPSPRGITDSTAAASR
jgi:MFS family permease